MKLISSLKQLFFVIIFSTSSGLLFANANLNIIIEGSPDIDKEIISSIIKDIDINTEDGLDQVLETLYETGNFKDISLNLEGENLYIKFIEYLKIDNINFEGNKRFKKEEILNTFSKSDYFDFYNNEKINYFIKDLNSLYASFGYNQVAISFKAEVNENKNVNLNFDIFEGKISKINKVKFIGNEKFTKNQLMTQIKSKPRNSFIFFTKRNYKEFLAINDVKNLKYFYKKNGFNDISISYKSEYIEDKNKFNLIFYINEGSRYEFNTILIKYKDDYLSALQKNNLEDILDNFNTTYLDKNSFFNIDYLDKISDLFTDYIFNEGLNFFEINIKERVNLNKIDILYEIKSTKAKYVRNINIYGNNRTLDRVIRREIVFVEGDPITDFLISKTDKRLKRLNIFESIDIVEVNVNDEIVDLDITVIEKSTGEFNVGLSLGTFDGATFVTKLKEKNIYGTGRNLDIEINTSSSNTIYKVGLMEPFFLNQDLSLNSGMSYSEKDFSAASSYNINTFSINSGIDYEIIENLYHNITIEYDLKDYEITNFNTVASSIASASGSNANIYLINRLSLNKLNSFYRPTNGNYIRFNNKFSPITNSRNGIFKNVLEYKKYNSLFENKYIFSIQSKIGNVFSLQDTDILNDEKFSLGGNWLRGFDSFGVGPRNSRTSYVGGDNLFVTKLDFKKPIIQNTDNPIDINLFTDFGTVYGNKINPTNFDNSFRASYGFGLNFYSAIGPIGFTWGFPLMDEAYDIKRMFFFQVGNLN